jgi:putative molybdopterin biosynthesis protein
VKQQQFLEVLDRDEAERRWREVIDATPLPAETLPLEEALGRVLAEDVRSEVDVPGFDRSNMDGFAVRAEDTFGASEEAPMRLRANAESIPTGVFPQLEVKPGTATTIATGGMLPRGADAVLPVEFTDLEEGDTRVVVRRSRTPGAAVSFAGTDIGRGETVVFAGTRLTSRETAHLAGDRGAGGDRAGGGLRPATSAGRDPLHRRRDRPARRDDATGPGLRQQRPHPRRRRARARRGSALSRRLS